MKFPHSFSRSESEIETARDREREVRMKKKFSRILEKRESRWSLMQYWDCSLKSNSQKNSSLQAIMKLSKYLYNDHHNTQSTINKVLVFQGDDMLHEIYYNIGVVEVQTVTICKKWFYFCVLQYVTIDFIFLSQCVCGTYCYH